MSIRAFHLFIVAALTVNSWAGIDYPEGDGYFAYQNHSCEGYSAEKRVPVYPKPDRSQAPIFVIPRLSQTCVVARFRDYGLIAMVFFNTHSQPLYEVVDEGEGAYGWVELSALRRDEDADGDCRLKHSSGHPDDRAESPDLETFSLCPTTFDLASEAAVVVINGGVTPNGKVYRTIVNASLNKCAKTCRDEKGCGAFFYSVKTSTCTLQHPGTVTHGGDEAFIRGFKLKQ